MCLFTSRAALHSCSLQLGYCKMLEKMNSNSQLSNLCIQVFITAGCDGAINGIRLQHVKDVFGCQLEPGAPELYTFKVLIKLRPVDTYPICYQKAVLSEDLTCSTEDTL